MKTELITQASYDEKMEEVLEKLKKIRKSGTFSRRTGEYIYYELYKRKEAKGWIAISHGFTESTVKYSEVIWYLIGEGYNVAICDHRGHGKSYRDVKEPWLTNVDRFADYCYDYCYFILNEIVPVLEGKPLYLLGHSMGGAIAAHVAERFPGLPIRKLILSSPMICPATDGHSKESTLMLTRFYSLRGKGRECVYVHHPFDGTSDFGEDWCCATSPYRHEWYLNLQRKNPMYQNTAASYHWLRESLKQSGQVLRRSNIKRIRIPVLLLQAGKDTCVKNSAQDQFISRTADGRKIVFPDARHEIFRCSDREVEQFIDCIVDFIES